jgi:DNA-binding CsgD family transcriptional regulator
LLERDGELGRLKVLVEGALARQGGVALIEGPAGIGKTRLLQEACTTAADRGLCVLSARGSDLERAFPYGVVRQLLEPEVVHPSAGPDASVLTGLAGYAAPVFGEVPLANERAAPTDRSASVLHGLYWLTCNLADRGPLIISVDDAHWADAPSLVFLDYLSRRMDGLAVVVALSSRRGESGPEADLVRRIASDAPERVLELGPLSTEATAEVVRSMLGDNASAELCKACHVATGGNPFLVHELVASLIADGVPAGADAVSRVARLVPDAVARHVLVRLSRLGQPSIRVARAIAVLGAGVGLGLVAALTGLAETETADAVDRLVSADILAAGLPLAFVHPLLAEAVYADAPPGERALAHVRAASLLEQTGSPPERIALQLLATDPTGSKSAVVSLRAAAREATARGAPSAAARYLERAIAELPNAVDRRDLLLELGVAESRAALPNAAGHLTEALRLTREPVARARVALELAGLYHMLGRFVESAAVLEEAIESLGDADQELRFSLEAEAAVLAVTVLEGRQTLAPRMASLLARAPALAGIPGAAPLLAVIAEELTEAEGTAEGAALYAERAFADPALFAREGPILVIGASAFVLADRPAQAESILDRAIAAARSRGAINGTRLALGFRAYARKRRGRIAESEADARLALELSAHEPADPVRPFKIAQLTDALIERGELTEAERLVSNNELAYYDRDSKLFQPLACSQARLLFMKGKYREAMVILDAQLAWMQLWGCRYPGWTSGRSLAALAHRALDEQDAALALAADDLEAARAFGAPREVGIALRTLALVGDRSPELLRESAAALEDSQDKLELARTLLDLGAALRRSGARREAREPLRRALDFADECGGALVAEHARQELLASGARPRPRQTRGREGLTPSERRVAALAREGFSNREVAQTLFLSPKTVEMHLSHIYRKLGIRGRIELAATLGADEGTGG